MPDHSERTTSSSAACPTPAAMAWALDYLIEHRDEIVGTPLEIPNVGTVWLHTQCQIEDWLREKFVEVVNGD